MLMLSGEPGIGKSRTAGEMTKLAEELFISHYTAGHHVSSMFSKTGCANRAELATYAARQGLTTL